MILVFRELHGEGEHIPFGYFTSESFANSEVNNFLNEFCEFSIRHFTFVDLPHISKMHGIKTNTRLPGNGSLGI